VDKRWQVKEELKKITEKEVQINIFEIKRPELDAYLVATSICRQISRISYRRAIKMAIAASMHERWRYGRISGRLNGAEMARSEGFKDGRVPLSTFRADIDYACIMRRILHMVEWVSRCGSWKVRFTERDLSPLAGMDKKQAGGKGGDSPRGNQL
jgi:small subunit ribosomal protein S3